ncbi:MAG TPA: hypothetical protein VJV05_00950 [Pyrinomonadaceae bacterium]|nr:hypothetical protein [Pyrinomonadaceae bacterium]
MKKLITNTAAKTAVLFSLFLIASGSSFAQSAGTTKADATNGASAAGPQTVNAQQAGPWTIGIDAAKNSVRVMNSAAEAVPVQIVRQPYHTKIFMTIFGGGSSSGTETSINVPEGKRLVIEAISAIAEVPSGERASLQILSYADGTSGSWMAQYVQLGDQGTYGTNSVLTANHKTFVYAVGRITLRARPTWTGANGSTSVSISGYLENLP